MGIAMSVWHPAPLAAARGRTTGVNKMNIAAIRRRWNVDKQLSSVREEEDGMMLDMFLPMKNNLATDIDQS